MTEHDDDTCGPWEGTWNRLIPQGPFRLACEVHDEDYTDNPASLTRREADRKMLDNMLALADGHPLWGALALAYYLVVRVSGWRYWRWS